MVKKDEKMVAIKGDSTMRQLTVVVQQTRGVQYTHRSRGDVTGRLHNLSTLRALSAVKDL
jgi:hypothetical protein